PSLRRSHFGRDFEAELAAAASRRWRPSFRMGCGDTALFIQSFSLRTATLPESANRQRATMQTPQGLDAQHRGELFPVNESYATPQSLSRRELLLPGLLRNTAASCFPVNESRWTPTLLGLDLFCAAVAPQITPGGSFLS